jgi:membrane dipeptidase
VRDLARWIRRFDECEDLFVKVKRTADVRLAHRSERVGIILNFQDLAYLAGDLDNLNVFGSLGIRIAQPTYNNQNLLGSGCTERVDGGRSYFGIDVYPPHERTRDAIDLSHAGSATTADAISVSRRPVICSHVGVRALTDNPRNKTDDQLRAVADTGGYIGGCTLPLFLAVGGLARLDDFLDHLEHTIEVVGVDQVGVGTDWSGSDVPPELQAILNRASSAPGLGLRGDPAFVYDFSMTVEGAEGWSDWPNLTRGMIARGYCDGDIQKLLGENLLRVMDTIWDDPAH